MSNAELIAEARRAFNEWYGSAKSEAEAGSRSHEWVRQYGNELLTALESQPESTADVDISNAGNDRENLCAQGDVTVEWGVRNDDGHVIASIYGEQGARVLVRNEWTLVSRTSTVTPWKEVAADE